jgi:hypothetical protein
VSLQGKGSEEEFKKWDEGIFRVTEREQQSEESKRSWQIDPSPSVAATREESSLSSASHLFLR